jgi:YD repeat-containing protein
VSATTVTDGNWHLATLVANGSTQQLYLDGQPSGAAINGAIEYDGQGYAYLGAGEDMGWPDAPSDISGHLNGDLADFAIYSYPLAAATIAGQYQTATSAAASSGTGMDASSAYRTQVVQDGPTDYWRLDDPSGSWYAQDELGTALPDPYAGTYSNTVLNAAGPSGNPDEAAATFNGTSSSVLLPATAAPTSGPASIELWFKTSAAGILYSYQSSPLESSSSYWNPALYVGTDGKLHGLFGDGNGSADLLSSSAGVTDNKWHQAVLTASGDTQTLYLDGAQQATESKGTLSFNGNGYVYLGAGTSSPSLWPASPAGDSTSTNYFTGSISEASYYPSALDAGTVQAHYKAMGSSASPTQITTVQVTDPGNNTLTYQYNATTQQLLAYTDAYGDTTRYGYDTDGFLQTVTDPDGHTTTYGHDADGNTVSTTTCRSAGDCQTSYATYFINPNDALDPRNDEIASSSDARSASATDTTYTTKYGYDPAGDLTSTVKPDGTTATDAYTAGTEAAPGGGTEPAGLLASTTEYAVIGGDGATTTYSYYSNGDLARSVSPVGLTTTYTYDSLGRTATKTEVSDSYPNGLTTTYTWDGQSHPLTQTDPATTDADNGTVVHTPQTYTRSADDTLLALDGTGGAALALNDQHNDLVGTFTTTHWSALRVS